PTTRRVRWLAVTARSSVSAPVVASPPVWAVAPTSSSGGARHERAHLPPLRALPARPALPLLPHLLASGAPAGAQSAEREVPRGTAGGRRDAAHRGRAVPAARESLGEGAAAGARGGRMSQQPDLFGAAPDTAR